MRKDSDLWGQAVEKYISEDEDENILSPLRKSRLADGIFTQRVEMVKASNDAAKETIPAVSGEASPRSPRSPRAKAKPNPNLARYRKAQNIPRKTPTKRRPKRRRKSTEMTISVSEDQSSYQASDTGGSYISDMLSPDECLDNPRLNALENYRQTTRSAALLALQ